MVLECNGFNVLTAASGPEALEVLRRKRVDLVLVDYEMPGMKGHEVASEIKGLDPHLPVVLQSGAIGLPKEVIRAADAFVPKGTKVSLLVAMILQLIIQRRSNGQHVNGRHPSIQ